MGVGFQKPSPDFPVVIVGAGPVGLTLALGLAKQGVRSLVVEKKEKLDEHSRAFIIAAATLECLHSYGIADALIQEGQFRSQVSLHDVDRGIVALSIDLDVIATETAYPGTLLMPQDRLEHFLLDRLLETGLSEVRFAQQFISYAENGEIVEVSLADSNGAIRHRTRRIPRGLRWRA